MKKIFLSLFGLVACSYCQTTYLRSSPPAATQISSISAGTPVIVNTVTAHGLTVGNVVTSQGNCASDGSVSGQSIANGIFLVYSTPTTTSLGLANLSNVPIAGTSSVNCDPINNTPGAAWIGLVTTYSLGSQPLGWLDGLNGSNFRKLATSTANGLVSLVVNTNVATVTTSFNHGMTTGDYIAVWNSGNSSLDKNGGNGCGSTSCSVVAYQVTVTGATTYTFPTVGVTNGTYSNVNVNCGPASTPNDTIGNTQDCLVVSQLAYQGNPFWDAANYLAGVAPGILAGTAYKYIIDGGSRYPDESNAGLGQFSLAALRFMVDKANTQMFNVSVYGLKNMYKMFGVNWTLNESQPGGGDYGLGANETTGGSVWLYESVASYLSSSSLSFVNNEIYNDLSDPGVTACNKSGNNLSTGHNKILDSGVATGGSSTTIVIQTPSIVPIANEIVQATVGGNLSFGVITGYNSGTLTVSVSSWSAGNPSNGTSYIIYATIVSSSTTAGGATTITGYGTTFVSDSVTAGDAVFGANGWGGLFSLVELGESFVSSVTSNTSLSAINSYTPNTGATPQIYWYVPQFTSTSCGMFWMNEHWTGYPGAQPILYPPSGGSSTLTISGILQGANNAVKYAAQWEALEFASANDSRAVNKLAQTESYQFDYSTFQPYMDYTTGTVHSGAYYSFVNTLPSSFVATAVTSLSVPSFPSLDTTNLSGWMQTPAIYKMFSVLPDFEYSPGYTIRTGSPARFGTENSTVKINYANGCLFVCDGAFLWQPTSNNAKWFRNWLSTTQTLSLWGFWGTSVGATALNVIYNDPRIGSSDFTVQPHQYLFSATSHTQCAVITGWVCPANLRGDTIISRTGWSRYNDTQTAGPSNTFVQYGSRVFAGDHDLPSNGTMFVYKVGELLGWDYNPPNDQTASNGSDQTIQGFMLQLGGSGATLVNNAAGTLGGYSPIISYSLSNHGSWSNAYGDQSNNYTCATSDLSGVYTTPANYIQRTFCHFKISGNDEFIVQWDSASLINPISGGIATHFHYPQIPTGGSLLAYPPGNTVTSGFGTLNTSKVVEVETGVADAYGDPTPNFGLATVWRSPNNMTATDDSVSWSGNSGACSGAACTYRISVCAASCGASASLFELMTVHKIMPNLTDNTLNCSTTVAVSNWFSSQCTGSNSGIVAIMSRGGVTHNSLSSITTAFSGTYQFIIGGISPGTYNVTVGGVGPNGSNCVSGVCTVASGDSFIEFTSTSGTVSVSPVGSATGGSIFNGKNTVQDSKVN